MYSKSKTSGSILITVFLVTLCAILFGTIFSWDLCGVQDYRGLATKPDFSARNLANIPVQFEAYLNDHFGFRNILFRRYNKLIHDHFVRKRDRTIIGRKNWLFFRDVILDYLGYSETKKEDLERWRLVVEGRHAWLAEKGICYVFVVPPNKESIYGEFLPREISVAKGQTRLEKLLAYMKSKSDFPILDLRPVLLKEKKYRRLYYLTDTHWNEYGRFLGFRQVIIMAKRCLPDITDPEQLDSLLFESRLFVGDLVRMGGLKKEDYSETIQVIKPCSEDSISQTDNKDDWVIKTIAGLPLAENRFAKHACNPKKKHCVIIFHDSFLPGSPFLFAEHFAEVYNLWFRADYDLLKKAVEHYHPDLVIDEVQERALYTLPDDHPEWAAARQRYFSRKRGVTTQSSSN